MIHRVAFYVSGSESASYIVTRLVEDSVSFVYDPYPGYTHRIDVKKDYAPIFRERFGYLLMPRLEEES